MRITIHHRYTIAIAALACLLFAGAALADTIELLSGAKSNGTVIERSDTAVKFTTSIGKMKITRTYRLDTIHAITVGGKREIINAKGSDPADSADPDTPTAPNKGTPGRPTSTRPASDGKPDSNGRKSLSVAEARALIQKVGATPPDWFDATPLTYPKTLDMSWAKPPKGSGWNPSKNIGQYMWSVINENPSKWKSGTKFMHHVLSVSNGNRQAQVQAIAALGQCYHNLLQDWVRAAFWYEQATKVGGQFPRLHLANAYWQMGCKPLAVQVLRKETLDRTRYGTAIKLWSIMGDLPTALKLAERTAKAGNPYGAYMGAGDACRHHGKYREAIAYYQKVLKLPSNKGRKEINKRNKERAQINIDTIKAVELLDPKRIPDGQYTGSSMSYEGPLEVQVTVAGGRITELKVTRHRDKQAYGAPFETPAKIIAAQSLKNIDTTTGATITSEAIINATAKALVDKMK